MTEQQKPAAPNASPTPTFDDHRLEMLMGRLLQTGVLLASTTVLIGGVLFLIARANQPANYRTFSAESAKPSPPFSPSTSTRCRRPHRHHPARHPPADRTPIARVLFGVIGFAIERDRLYTAVSIAVLTILIISLSAEVKRKGVWHLPLPLPLPVLLAVILAEDLLFAVDPCLSSWTLLRTSRIRHR